MVSLLEDEGSDDDAADKATERPGSRSQRNAGTNAGRKQSNGLVVDLWILLVLRDEPARTTGTSQPQDEHDHHPKDGAQYERHEKPPDKWMRLDNYAKWNKICKDKQL